MWRHISAQQDRLRLVRADHAAETQHARGLGGEGQHHVGALDARQFVEDRPRAVAEPGLRCQCSSVFQST